MRRRANEQRQGKLKTDSATGSNEKYGPGPDPLQQEAKLSTIVAPDSVTRARMLAIVNAMITEPGLHKHEIKALRMWKANLAAESIEGLVQEEFLRDFWGWMIGRGKEVDHMKTPWYRQSLAADKEVASYIDTFVEKMHQFRVKLQLMSMRVPVGINQVYLYYKYIVRGEKPEESNFLSDWALFQEEFHEARDEPFNQDWVNKKVNVLTDENGDLHGEYPHPHEVAPYGDIRKEIAVKKDKKLEKGMAQKALGPGFVDGTVKPGHFKSDDDDDDTTEPGDDGDDNDDNPGDGDDDDDDDNTPNPDLAKMVTELKNIVQLLRDDIDSRKPSPPAPQPTPKEKEEIIGNSDKKDPPAPDAATVESAESKVMLPDVPKHIPLKAVDKDSKHVEELHSSVKILQETVSRVGDTVNKVGRAVLAARKDVLDQQSDIQSGVTDLQRGQKIASYYNRNPVAVKVPDQLKARFENSDNPLIQLEVAKNNNKRAADETSERDGSNATKIKVIEKKIEAIQTKPLTRKHQKKIGKLRSELDQMTRTTALGNQALINAQQEVIRLTKARQDDREDIMERYNKALVGEKDALEIVKLQLRDELRSQQELLKSGHVKDLEGYSSEIQTLRDQLSTLQNSTKQTELNYEQRLRNLKVEMETDMQMQLLQKLKEREGDYEQGVADIHVETEKNFEEMRMKYEDELQQGKNEIERLRTLLRPLPPPVSRMAEKVIDTTLKHVTVTSAFKSLETIEFYKTRPEREEVQKDNPLIRKIDEEENDISTRPLKTNHIMDRVNAVVQPQVEILADHVENVKVQQQVFDESLTDAAVVNNQLLYAQNVLNISEGTNSEKKATKIVEQASVRASESNDVLLESVDRLETATAQRKSAAIEIARGLDVVTTNAANDLKKENDELQKREDEQAKKEADEYAEIEKLSNFLAESIERGKAELLREEEDRNREEEAVFAAQKARMEKKEQKLTEKEAIENGKRQAVKDALELAASNYQQAIEEDARKNAAKVYEESIRVFEEDVKEREATLARREKFMEAKRQYEKKLAARIASFNENQVKASEIATARAEEQKNLALRKQQLEVQQQQNNVRRVRILQDRKTIEEAQKYIQNLQDRARQSYIGIKTAPEKRGTTTAAGHFKAVRSAPVSGGSGRTQAPTTSARGKPSGVKRERRPREQSPKSLSSKPTKKRGTPEIVAIEAAPVAMEEDNDKEQDNGEVMRVEEDEGTEEEVAGEYYSQAEKADAEAILEEIIYKFHENIGGEISDEQMAQAREAAFAEVRNRRKKNLK